MRKLIISFLLLTTGILAQSIKDDVENAIRDCFGNGVKIQQEKVTLKNYGKTEIEKEVGQKFYSDEVYFYKIYNQEKIKGYAILDNVYGKSLPITFLVVFDSSSNIKCTEIIRYREPYGGAIQNKEWNDQFTNKNIQSEFKVGKDVYNISGATISVNSVTKGIKKLTILINRLLKK